MLCNSCFYYIVNQQVRSTLTCVKDVEFGIWDRSCTCFSTRKHKQFVPDTGWVGMVCPGTWGFSFCHYTLPARLIIWAQNVQHSLYLNLQLLYKHSACLLNTEHRTELCEEHTTADDMEKFQVEFTGKLYFLDTVAIACLLCPTKHPQALWAALRHKTAVFVPGFQTFPVWSVPLMVIW